MYLFFSIIDFRFWKWLEVKDISFFIRVVFRKGFRVRIGGLVSVEYAGGYVI